jgi:hypothetical protein
MRRIAHVRVCGGSGRVIAQSYPDDERKPTVFSPHFSHLSSQNARNSTLEVFFHYEGAIALL